MAAKRAKKKKSTRPSKKKSAGPSKKRAKKSSSRKKLPAWTVGVTVSVLAILVLGMWLLIERPYQDIPVPVYEEDTGNGFTELVGEVELAIYQSLRQLGVPASQVKFGKVIHRTQQNRQWDFTELTVSIVKEQSLANVEELFARNLTGFGNQVTWEIRKKKDTDLELLIRVEEALTHRLAFFLRSKQLIEKVPPTGKPKLAIVIDDLGHDRRLARRFLEIEGPLSFSVLPNGTFSESIAQRVHGAGRELLLHLPMEPKDYPKVNPGEGALLVKMTDAEMLQTLRKDLDSLPYISGVNNHMGSRFSESEHNMRVVMEELKYRGLFFLDSRTSKKTKAFVVAQQLGVPSAERNVFLDNIQSSTAIRGQLKRLIQLARLKGRAIGIAHPYEVTLGVLKQEIPKLSSEGVELVPVSRLMQR
jgi:polysaccharide deacetylase 2 family uncharacterized protein YibQ